MNKYLVRADYYFSPSVSAEIEAENKADALAKAKRDIRFVAPAGDGMVTGSMRVVKKMQKGKNYAKA